MNVINKLKNKREYIFAFLVPFTLLILVLFLLGVVIRVENTLFVSDLQAQYVALLSEFTDLMSGESSLFYSFEKGMGGNMIGTIAYYLVSPINLILFFFSNSSLHLAFVFLLSIKLSLAGLTMYIFLKYHFNKQKTLYLLIFSTLYALMAFNVGYYFHIMWLDGIYLLPLVMLGIDKIIGKKSPLLYGITLFMSVLTNFYIGYMICLFSVIYFVYRLVLNCDKNKLREIIKKIIDFSVVSLLAGLSTFFLVIPTLSELAITPKLQNNVFVSETFKINFNIFDTISRMFIGSQNSQNILNPDLAFIYTGIIVLPLVVLYFLNKKISKKEKMSAGLVFGIFLISFSINYVSFVWHGFNLPLAFNQRFSFLYSFFIIVIAAQSFFKLKYIKNNLFLLVFLGWTLVAIPTILMNYKHMDNYLIVVSIFLVGCYLGLFYLMNNKKYQLEIRKINYLIAALVFAELFFNFYISVDDYHFSTVDEFNGSNYIFGEQIKKVTNEEESKFYRLEKTYRYGQLDSFYYGYNGINVFASTLSSNVINFFNNVGYSNFPNSVLYEQINPLVDSLLGVKYLFLRDYRNFYYEKLDEFTYSRYDDLLYNIQQTQVTVAENPNALSLGYMISDQSITFDQQFLSSKHLNQFGFMDYILNTMTNDYRQVFKPVSYKVIDKSNYELTVTDHDNIFMLFYVLNGNDKSSLDILVQGGVVKTYHTTSNGFFVIKNIFNIGDKIKIATVPDGDSRAAGNPALYYFDYETFNKKIDMLKPNQLNVIENKGHYIKGSVNATDDKQILFTSIPHEPGWTAYVDGEKTDIVKLYGAFNGLELKSGKHIVEFKFYPPGLKLGLFVSTTSVLLAGIYFAKRDSLMNQIDKKRKGGEDNE